MYELYERSTVWRRLVEKDEQYYRHEQEARALLCLTQEPAAEGFGYVTTLPLRKGVDEATACISGVDVLEEIYFTESHEAWVEIQYLGGPTIKLDVAEVVSLPVIALQGSTITLHVKPQKLDANGAVSYCRPCVRYSCVNASGRRGLALENQTWRGYTISGGRMLGK